MTTSAWGVEHGSEVSKSASDKSHIRHAAAWGVLGPAAGTIHAGVRAKRGRKAAATATTLGTSFVGAGVGGVLGAKVGGLRGAGIGGTLGQTAGSVAGSAGGAALNTRSGRIKGRKAKRVAE